VVAATNRDLGVEVRDGRFREDLYYRLAVFPVTVPPLRERRSDLPALCVHVLTRLGAATELGADVRQLLSDHDWPGNVRELENVLERALILSGGAPIRPQHIQLPEPVLVHRDMTETRSGISGRVPSTSGSLHDMERQMLEDALRKSGGNKSKAAKLLGITRRMLYTKLEKYGLAKDEVSDAE
jgi:DNA-binding NtrC family response regulator